MRSIIPVVDAGMGRNIEIKARCPDRAELLTRVEVLAGSAVAELYQDDTFFNCPHGRLKLRDFGDGHAELIAYERPDSAGPRLSSYTRSQTADPAGLRDALTRTLGVWARVVKTRRLYLAGRTRIHVDRIRNLGDFVELEVVLEAKEPGAMQRRSG